MQGWMSHLWQAAVIAMGAVVLFFWWQSTHTAKKPSYTPLEGQELAQRL